MKRHAWSAVSVFTLVVAASLAPPALAGSSGDLTYHGGPVMHTTTTYAIFWLPAGAHFEPGGGDARYEALIERFLGDVGGTPFYGILTQYSHAAGRHLVVNGPILNRSTFGGAYTETAPYPGAGPGVEPMGPMDLQEIVANTIRMNNWSPGLDRLYIVFTAAGVNVGLCGIHESFRLHGRVVIAALVASVHSLPSCSAASHAGMGAASPNHDPVADAEISLLSHELFEAVTDPVTDAGRGGWYDMYPSAEVADKCEGGFDMALHAARGTVKRLRRFLVHLHTHTYLVQREWSNIAHRCVLG